MRIGIVSDVHCNADALRLAFERMGAVDELLCAGDSIYEYRFSNDVIELLRERGARYVLGNHESVFLGPQGARARAAANVRHDLVEYMASQPLSIEVDVGGKRLVMVHATPFEPYQAYVFPGSPELQRLAGFEADYVILGHTHTQMAERVGRALVINPGSGGDARDLANGRRFSYAVLDTSSGEVLFDNFLPGDPPTPAFEPACR
ncbi:MAG TPA: metallophosphoesterase family protein [Dehalococcoidia bacterium]|nr:metallophosphoesterase family protein [Dehalococcoidia bacterium]